MEAKVILFHSNESDKCKAFINNDVSLITSKNVFIIKNVLTK